MVHLFLLLLLNSGEYDMAKRYNDSLLIYNTYKSQIEMLKKCKSTDAANWRKRSAFDDSLTVCAKVRLWSYNKKTYEPVKEHNREGYGVAYSYPEPSMMVYAVPDAFQKDDSRKFRYTVLDKQVHFITSVSPGANGKNSERTRIPYLMQRVYDRGQLVYIEKLDPVTLRLLAEPGAMDSAQDDAGDDENEFPVVAGTVSLAVTK